MGTTPAEPRCSEILDRGDRWRTSESENFHGQPHGIHETRDGLLRTPGDREAIRTRVSKGQQARHGMVRAGVEFPLNDGAEHY